MSQNNDISANDIPDILAGTTGTEELAYQNDQGAVNAGLAQDPNLLAEVLQPGFVELVNELAGDAPPTLGSVETVGQSYQDANGESMGQAFSDLQGQQPNPTDPAAAPAGAGDEIQQIETQLQQLESELNPQPLPPGPPEESPFESAQAESPFETAQAEPYSFESGQSDPGIAPPTEEYGQTMSNDVAY